MQKERQLDITWRLGVWYLKTQYFRRHNIILSWRVDKLLQTGSPLLYSFHIYSVHFILHYIFSLLTAQLKPHVQTLFYLVIWSRLALIHCTNPAHENRLAHILLQPIETDRQRSRNSIEKEWPEAITGPLATMTSESASGQIQDVHLNKH